ETLPDFRATIRTDFKKPEFYPLSGPNSGQISRNRDSVRFPGQIPDRFQESGILSAFRAKFRTDFKKRGFCPISGPNSGQISRIRHSVRFPSQIPDTFPENKKLSAPKKRIVLNLPYE